MDKQLNNISVELYKKTLNRGQNLDIKVGGSSMWPFIKDGETLVLSKASYEDISKGDVIATYADEKLTCHRVFRKNHNFIQTKADALVGLDAKISYDNVVGKVIAQKRSGHIYKHNGWISQLTGKCILWVSFFWAPLIPILRRCKAFFVR